jgi:hypothetical protein
MTRDTKRAGGTPALQKSHGQELFFRGKSAELACRSLAALRITAELRCRLFVALRITARDLYPGTGENRRATFEAARVVHAQSARFAKKYRATAWFRYNRAAWKSG